MCDALRFMQTRMEQERRSHDECPVRLTTGVEDQVRAEDHFRLVIDATPALIHTARPDGALDYLNKRWLDYLGAALDDVKDWKWTTRLHPEDVEAFIERWRSSLRTGELFEAEARVCRADGTYRWMLYRNMSLRDDKGNIVKWYGSSIDIDDRRRAEDALRRSEAFLAEAQRISHIGSWVWKPATGEVASSKERFRIFGIDPEKTKPSFNAFWEKVHLEDQPRFKQILDSAICEKRDFEHEYRIVTPEGLIKSIHSTGHPVFNESGELAEFIGTTMDITERKRAEEALHEAQAGLARVPRVIMMGELAASIAHEVNQQLAGVVSSANAGLNWLAKNPPNLPKAREAIERILRDANPAGQVLDRIRSLLKRSSPIKTSVNVTRIIREVVALFGGQLRQKNVELAMELDPSVPAVMGDSIQLQQVLLNLLINAVEAMAGIVNRQRTLRIRSERGDLDGRPAVSVKVSDAGSGLSPTAARRLFEPFHTTKPEGMGMGLWISRSIIEAHGGRLTALSNDGPGATFQVLLPAQTGGSE